MILLEGLYKEREKVKVIKFFLTILFLASTVFAKGDLAIRAKKLELKLGSEKSDYEMSQKVFELETGKAYRLEISMNNIVIA